MSSALKARLTADMKTAMKAGEKARLGTIRLALAALKQREVDERIELSDSDVIDAITKMVKQRRESIVQYDAGGRDDLSVKEQAEIEVLMDYLPKQLSEPEIETLVASAVTESAATSMRDMGKIMAILRPKVQGRADMQLVSAKVKARLTV